jgi:hypothetical protein
LAPEQVRAASLLGSLSGDLGQNLSACPHPLVRFHSPSEFDQLALPRSPAVAGAGAPSMGFPSLRRRQLGESTSPGLASPGTFRLQVFSTSWRVTPPRTLRVCFTPLTSVGFCPPELSPRHVPWHLAGARCPLAVAFLPFASPRYPVNGGALRARPRFGRSRPCGRLQGVAHVSSSFKTYPVLPILVCRCSPGLCPL